MQQTQGSAHYQAKETHRNAGRFKEVAHFSVKVLFTMKIST